MASGFRCGHLIRGGVLGEALRLWCFYGATPHAWARVRAKLAERYPEAPANSLDALIRYAQAGRLAGRETQRRAPDGACPPGMIPDARRVLRESRKADER
jgi:hypothetical protein